MARWMEARLHRDRFLGSPGDILRYTAARLRGYRAEVFAVLFLDTRHRVIAFEELFRSTVGETTVHPHEVVRRTLAHNAAVIFAHNHPSGAAELPRPRQHRAPGAGPRHDGRAGARPLDRRRPPRPHPPPHQRRDAQPRSRQGPRRPRTARRHRGARPPASPPSSRPLTSPASSSAADVKGQRAAARLKARVLAQGIAATVLTPGHGDFNDDLAALGPRGSPRSSAPGPDRGRPR